jgi:hypothetical protein
MEATPPPSVPDLSLPQRVWGVLISPRVVFEYIKVRPRVLGVLLITVLLVLASTLPILDILVETQMDQLEERGGLTDEQMATQEKLMRGGMPLGGLIFILGTMFAGAGVLLFLSNVILGGQANYRQFLSMLGHVQMVLIPAVLIKVPLTLMTGKPVLTSLAALLPSDAEQGFMWQLMNQLDVFSLWMLGLAALGLGVLAGTSTGRAATVLGITWGIVVLALSGLGAALQGLGGAS